jgi:O-antigen/teichoic acid export membrane protein
MSDVKQQISRGAAWMVALKFAMRSVSMVSTIILARLLLPTDFGLVAMAMALFAVVELIGAFNFHIALIQNQNAPRSHYDTVWTMEVLLGVFIGALLVALAGSAAEFYAEPRLQFVIYFVAIGAVITGAKNIGVVAFQKDLEFHREFVFLLSQKLAGFVVAIPLAFYWRNYWALIAGFLASRVVGLIASYVMHSFRPRLSLRAWQELFHFSKWLLLNNTLYVIRHRVADFAIGKMSGARQLGIFSLSYEIATLATTEIAAPINRAVLPGFARMSASLAILRDGYFSSIGIIALIGIPAALGISATADNLIPVLLGPKWLSAVPVVQLLGIAGSVSILAFSIDSVCIAVGKPQLLTLANGIYVAILLPLIFILTPQFGSIGAAWAFVIAAIVGLPLQLLIVLRVLESGFGNFLAVIWRPALAAAVMYQLVTFISIWFGDAADLAAHVVQLGVSIIAGAGCYIVVVLVLWQLSGRSGGAEMAVIVRVRPMLTRR